MSSTDVSRLISEGQVAAFGLALGLALSPFVLVFAPIIPLAIVVYMTMNRHALGTRWMALYIASWIVLVVSFWPFLGLSAY